jgi:hypothetical protein
VRAGQCSESVRLVQRISNEEHFMAGSSHGHSPAAWTGVIISFIGFCVGGVFMVADNVPGFWVGVGVVLIGGVVGLALRVAGLGVPKESEAMAEARAKAGRSQTQSV